MLVPLDCHEVFELFVLHSLQERGQGRQVLEQLFAIRSVLIHGSQISCVVLDLGYLAPMKLATEFRKKGMNAVRQ